ncbi:peptidylprolyl isomerase [Jeotgalibacillus campisalis]|uniref:Peptidyl-prolyl cis-trans isomerase n=1 Tax=Jeotgalibacillus campisalis TaxID=220754 RepID=A0A0C2VI12_9BACL|nr:peptidylprolyl isomerase [Jeotgalibacillus campisalis]KIL43648.1 peptidylprolyl isomerase [Jeotgalibacillus campisalis]
MKIKLLGIFLIFILMLSACGSNEEEAVTGGSEEEQTEETTETEETDESTEADESAEAGSNEPVEYPQLNEEATDEEPVAKMVTNKGEITIKFFPEYAPKAVENFLTHSKDGYYDGVTFHRVIDEFMIQGGDPEGTGRGGESIYGEAFEDEFTPSLIHVRGALSMANSGPNTNGSQFFIVQNKELPEGFTGQMEEADFPEDVIAAYDENGGTPQLDGVHTVFGQVIEGMEIVDEIASVEKDESDKPEEDVIIESIEIIQE